MSDRYWVQLPGSAEPPQGPFELPELKAKWHTRQIPALSTICKIGDSNWVTIESVLGPREDSPQQANPLPGLFNSAARGVDWLYSTPQQANPLPSLSKEPKYENLVSVAGMLQTWGSILHFVGFLVGAGGALAFLGVPSVILASGIFALGIAYGIGLYVLGTITAAAGEALLAIRDIAVNTRTSADAITRALS